MLSKETEILSPLQKIAEEIEHLHSMLDEQACSGWYVIRKGYPSNDSEVIVEHKRESGPGHSFRIECELTAPLEQLIFVLNEV